MINSDNYVQLKVEGRIATLGLNRPESFNAINEEMVKQLNVKLTEVKESEADFLIIYGNGKGFSAGGDIRTMTEIKDEERLCKVMDEINEMILTLYTLPKITISAVHGAAAGLGFSLALATDYILADETAVLAMNFIKIGLIPDGGSHYFLNKRLGEAKAKQLIWAGDNLNANDAFAMGLIDEVTGDDVLAKAKEKAGRWLTMPLQSMLQTKKIFTDKGKAELKELLEIEKKAQVKMRKTADHLEGIQAFLEKRKPNFIGR